MSYAISTILKIKHTVIEGGEQRFYSVKNGLNAITEAGIVAIHDACQAIVSLELIKKFLSSEGERKGNLCGGGKTGRLDQKN